MFPANIFFYGCTDPSWLEALHYRGFTITHVHVTLRLTTIGRTPLINTSQRPLPDKKKLSQVTNLFVPGGIVTQNLSKRAALGPLFRPRFQLDRFLVKYKVTHKTVVFKIQSQQIYPRILIFPEHVTHTCGTCISET